MERHNKQHKGRRREMVTEEITAEHISDVEAAPFFPDGTESVIMEAEALMLNPSYKTGQMSGDRSDKSLQNDIYEHKVLIGELRTSLDILKTSNMRIERDVREMSRVVAQSNSEKDDLTNSISDLKLLINQHFSRQEETYRVIIREEMEKALRKINERICKLEMNDPSNCS